MRDGRRLRTVSTIAGMLALAASAGCDGRGATKWIGDRLPGSHARPETALAWQEVEPAALVVNNDPSLHAVRFSIHLPAATGLAAGSPPPQPRPAALEIAFHDRLDGAKVDAYASGPRHTVQLLDRKRFAGDAVVVPLPPLPLTDVEVVVHNHLRPPPVIRRLRLGRTRAAAAMAPPANANANANTNTGTNTNANANANANTNTNTNANTGTSTSAGTNTNTNTSAGTGTATTRTTIAATRATSPGAAPPTAAAVATGARP